MTERKRRWTLDIPETGDGTAFELEITDETVTLGWTRFGQFHKTVHKTVAHPPPGWEPSFRSTTRTDGAGRRIWVNAQLNPDKERAAREYLERKYEHVLTLHDSEAMLNEARSIREKDYWDDVRGCADSLVERIKAGEFESTEALHEAVRQDVDGSARVIYTHLAIECLLYSKYDGRAVEEGLVDASAFKDGIPWSAMAYAAFEQDVYDQLDALGIDVNSDTFGLEEDETDDDEDSA